MNLDQKWYPHRYTWGIIIQQGWGDPRDRTNDKVLIMDKNDDGAWQQAKSICEMHNGDFLDPDMSDAELRLHMGEMTAQECRTAKAAIRWANSHILENK